MRALDKGKRFERQVVKLLEQLTGAKWHRVPQSGAMAKTHELEYDPRFNGDVFCEKEPFNKWVVECKSTKDPLTLNELFNENSRFWSWWAQATSQVFGDCVPLLFFKWNRGPVFVAHDVGNTARLEKWIRPRLGARVRIVPDIDIFEVEREVEE